MNQEKGMTLMEILATLALLAFGLTALGHFQATLQNQSRLVRQQSQALMFAAQRLADLRLEIAAGRPGGGRDLIGPGDCCDLSLSGLDTRYQRQWTSRRIAEALWQIQVSVSWRDHRGEAQSIALYSLAGRVIPLDDIARGFDGVTLLNPPDPFPVDSFRD